MGISIKLSKVGKRVHPQPCPSPAPTAEDDSEADAEAEMRCESSRASSRPTPQLNREGNGVEATNDANGRTVSSTCSGGMAVPEHEVSFVLNLYESGYRIGKPSEDVSHSTLQDVRSLHPYDRASENMFSAIETGRLPGDILDEIPCKYYNGRVICEIRDYRRPVPEDGYPAFVDNGLPVIHKLELMMALENIVKDMSRIADDSWTYRDLMEVESRIVKALQPDLCLDPTPRLDRLCSDPAPNKIDLGIKRKRRLRQAPEVIVTHSPYGKKICLDRALENVGYPMNNSNNAKRVLENTPAQSFSGGSHSTIAQNNCAQEAARLGFQSPSGMQHNANYSPLVSNGGAGPPINYNTSISSPQNFVGGYNETVGSNGLVQVKKEDSQPLVDPKRLKQTTGIDDYQQNHLRPQTVNLTAQDMQWRNQQLNQQDVRRMQHPSTFTGQRYPSPMINNLQGQEQGNSVYFNHQGMRVGPKMEQTDKDKFRDVPSVSKESIALDQPQLRSQYMSQQAMARNNQASISQWQNSQALLERGSRKDDMHQRRKLTPPSGSMVQSPVSSKSGELSSGSIGGQFNQAAATSIIGSHQEKLANPNGAAGATSVSSSPNDSMHRLQHPSASGKRKANPGNKSQAPSGVGSPSSAGDIAPMSGISSSLGPASIGDQAILERFVKIVAITQRHKLNARKNKIDNFPPRKAVSHATELASRLSDCFVPEEFIDENRPISGSIIGGTINSCKTRKMCFLRADRIYQDVPVKPDFQCLFKEKVIEGTVEMHFGDFEDPESLHLHGCTVTLATKEYADLLAGQYIVLMEQYGFQKTDDQVQPQMAPPASFGMISGQLADNATNDVKPSSAALCQAANSAGLVNNGNMGPAGTLHPSNSRLPASGNSGMPLQMTQGYLPGTTLPSKTQGIDLSSLQHQQMHNPHAQIMQQSQIPLSQMQRSQLLSSSPLSQMLGHSSNLQMGVNMSGNKLTPLQIQALQQQQQTSQMPRKMMAGLSPAMGVGNVGNSVVGLGNLGNSMGIGAIRGLSSPMGAASSLGNINPNQLNLGMGPNIAGLRPGSLSPQQAAAVKLRMAHQRGASMYNPQSGISGITGNTHPLLSNSTGLSMVGPAMSRANMNLLNRPAISAMGPPKMQGPNFFLNQQQQQLQQQQQFQQQQQLQQQQQQMQLQQQQMQQPQQQQATGSPRKQQPQVGSPPAVGSQSSMMAQPQQMNPNQVSQQHSTLMSPQQLSSGPLNSLNNAAGNAVPGPASPQLSSQTHGSVGSITSSPIEQLQGANKGGVAGNV